MKACKKFMAAVVIALAATIVVSCGAAAPAYAEETRSPAVIRLFKETHVCPATGVMATKGKTATYKCPGWEVDHGIPFCVEQYTGLNVDQVYNLSYQKYDKENSLRKDADERTLCAVLKSLTANQKPKILTTEKK